MAIRYLNFSTWEGTHGIHLEDLYVRPAARGSGAGRALLTALAAISAEVIGDWLRYRLTGGALHRLADRATPSPRVS